MRQEEINQPDWSLLAFAALAIIGGSMLGLLMSKVDNPLYLAAAVFAPCLLIAVILRPEWGLLGLFVMTYIRFSDVTVKYYGAPSTAKLFIAFLILIIAMRWWWFGNRPEGWQRASLLVLGYGLVSALSLLYADYFDITKNALSDYAKDAIIVIIIAVLLNRANFLRQAIWSLLAAGIFMGTISVFQQLTGTFDHNYGGFGQAEFMHIVGQANDYRVGGPFGSPNAYSQIMLPLIPLALDRLWNERNKVLRVLAGWAFIATVLTVIFTFSRNGFMSMVIMLALMFVRRPPRASVLIATIVIAIPLLQFVPGQYMERISTLSDLLPNSNNDAREEISFRGRLSENISGWMMFSDHPITGVGLANFPKHYQSYARHLGIDNRRVERGAHNLYLQIAAEQGLVGLVAFGTMVGLLFYGLHQARQNFLAAHMPDYAGIALAFSIGLLGYLLAGIFIHMAYPRHFWLLVGTAIAIFQIARNELQRTQKIVT